MFQNNLFTIYESSYVTKVVIASLNDLRPTSLVLTDADVENERRFVNNIQNKQM